MVHKIGVVGLGYVGLPVAIEFGKKFPVVGFDINPFRIEQLKEGYDQKRDVSKEEFMCKNIIYTSSPEYLSDCDFIVVAVPTPITTKNEPDFNPLINSSEIIGRVLSKGTIVVYESTVYPGTTEELCVPILEETSGLKCGKDFHIGYSPERINPGDSEKIFSNVKKVISAQNQSTLEVITDVYSEVVTAGVFQASSIKVAEASKIVENIQRDVNIALMNELSMIFHLLDIDTKQVLDAAKSKWNFVPFEPGLVGGHCIGVDPYYLISRVENTGYYPELMLTGRRINNRMGKFVAQNLLKLMINRDININRSIVTVFGLTFKENVSDIRNTKVVDIIRELEEYGVIVQVSDEHADKIEVSREYSIDLLNQEDLQPADAIIVAVPHKEYIDDKFLGSEDVLKNENGIVIDLKGKLDENIFSENVLLWSL